MKLIHGGYRLCSVADIVSALWDAINNRQSITPLQVIGRVFFHWDYWCMKSTVVAQCKKEQGKDIRVFLKSVSDLPIHEPNTLFLCPRLGFKAWPSKHGPVVPTCRFPPVRFRTSL